MTRRPKRRDWNALIPLALCPMRARRNRATGMSPNYALYGIELPYPGDWGNPIFNHARQTNKRDHRQRRQIIRKRQLEFNTKQYQKDARPFRQFNVGDEVFARETRPKRGPFSPLWAGPFQITDKHSPEVYSLLRDNDVVKLHIDDLRPAPKGNTSDPESENSDDDADEPQTPSDDDLIEEDNQVPSQTLSDNDERITEPPTQNRPDPEPPASHPKASADQMTMTRPQQHTDVLYPDVEVITPFPNDESSTDEDDTKLPWRKRRRPKPCEHPTPAPAASANESTLPPPQATRPLRRRRRARRIVLDSPTGEADDSIPLNKTTNNSDVPSARIVPRAEATNDNTVRTPNSSAVRTPDRCTLNTGAKTCPSGHVS